MRTIKDQISLSTRPRDDKTFFMLSMTFKLLINTDIVQISGNFRIRSPKLFICRANKCLIPWITVRKRADTFSNDAAQVLFILTLVAI